MNSALLVIDMINDFLLPGAPLEVPMGRDIIQTIKWEVDKRVSNHEKNDIIIYVCDNHGEGDKEFKYWPKHALTGTDGARLDTGVQGSFNFWNSLGNPNKPTGWYICKKTYSGFLNTGLDNVLQKRGIEEIAITGILTNICVFIAAIEAQMRGYKVSVIRDCVATLSQEANDRALEELEKTFKVNII